MNAQSFAINTISENLIDLNASTTSPQSPSVTAFSNIAPIDLQSSTPRSASLLFIDQTVDGYQMLVNAALPDTEVHVLDPAQDAIAQITQVLAGRHHISNLQIVSHGNAARLQFASTELSLNTLPTYTSHLQTWANALSPDADIILYGCNVAQGELGQAFVQILSQLTQADVAASSDITGRTGNWTLEFHQGEIEATLPFNADGLSAYDADLLGSDYDNNGTADLVAINYLTGEVQLQLLDGTTTLSTTTLATVVGWQIAGTADFDGNGYTDLFWQNRGTGDTGVWLMDVSGAFTPQLILNIGGGSDWQVVGIEDFDLNGSPDILWRSQFYETTGAWLMAGTAIAGIEVLPYRSKDWVATGFADVNGDTFDDILWRNIKTGANEFWLLNGTNVASTIALPNRATPWVIQELGDWNGDTVTDILWRNYNTGEVDVWTLNNGNFTGVLNTTAPGGVSWTILDSRDLDSNGTPDLIVRNYLTGENAYWMMDNTTCTNVLTQTSTAGMWDVIAAA